MAKNCFRGAVGLALIVAMVLGAGTFAQAQENEDGGPVIQIGKADPGDSTNLSTPSPTDGAIVDSPQAPKYWIGLVGGPIGPDHPLRAHIDLPDNQGLLIVSVVPDSPAASAGIKANDILLRANDVELTGMQDLVGLVLSEGEKQGQIAIDVLRRGERETLTVKPQERPADAHASQGNFPRGLAGGLGPDFTLPGGVELPRELMDEFGNEPFAFRNFGPGVIVGGGGMSNLPKGVSVSITKKDNEPTRIIVKRGDETWEVVGDDPGSLERLPEDLRLFVDRMLHGRTHGLNLRGHDRLMPELGDGRIRERLDRMEKRMQELQERFMQQHGSVNGDDATK